MEKKEKPKLSPDAQTDFLLREYEQLWCAKEAINQRQLQLGKLYLTAIGALFAATLAIHNLATNVSVLTFASVAALLVVMLGTYAYLVAVSSLFSFVIYMRAINNIRLFFRNLHPENAKYFSLPTDRRSPSMAVFSFHCTLYSILNSGFLGLGVALGILQFDARASLVMVAIVVALGAFVSLLIINYFLYRFIRKERLRKKRSAQVI